MQDNFWLAIQTPAAGKSLRGGRITPGEWERRRGLRLSPHGPEPSGDCSFTMITSAMASSAR